MNKWKLFLISDKIFDKTEKNLSENTTPEHEYEVFLYNDEKLRLKCLEVLTIKEPLPNCPLMCTTEKIAPTVTRNKCF